VICYSSLLVSGFQEVNLIHASDLISVVSLLIFI